MLFVATVVVVVVVLCSCSSCGKLCVQNPLTSTMSPRAGVRKLNEIFSTTATSPTLLNVGSIDEPTHCENPKTCSFSKCPTTIICTNTAMTLPPLTNHPSTPALAAPAEPSFALLEDLCFAFRACARACVRALAALAYILTLQLGFVTTPAPWSNIRNCRFAFIAKPKIL